MMMVLAIVGILSVVAVPKYRAMTDYYHLQSSVQTVTSFIRYAKQRALDEHKLNYVEITKATNTVRVLNLDLLVVQSKTLAAGVTLPSDTNTDVRISFDNRGYLVPNPQNDPAVFTLKGSSNRMVNINIDLLGNVTAVWN